MWASLFKAHCLADTITILIIIVICAFGASKTKNKKTHPLINPQGAILLWVYASLLFFAKKRWCVNRFGRMVEEDHLNCMLLNQSILTYRLPHFTAETDGHAKGRSLYSALLLESYSLPPLVISGLHFSPNGGRFRSAGRSSSVNTPCGIGTGRLKPTVWAVSTVRLWWHVAYTNRLRSGSDGTLLPYGRYGSCISVLTLHLPPFTALTRVCTFFGEFCPALHIWKHNHPDGPLGSSAFKSLPRDAVHRTQKLKSSSAFLDHLTPPPQPHLHIFKH